MGINSWDLEVLIKLRESGFLPDPGAVVEIGAQQLSNDFLMVPERVAHLGRLFGVDKPLALPPASPKSGAGLDPAAPYACEFWRWLGFDYATIDIDGSPGAIALDLNFDNAPDDAKGKYQLVTNYGTTEHVANQLNAFEVIHDLTAPNGFMIHALPTQGMFNHGLINYNFKFFWMLARSNGYKFVHADFSRERNLDPLPEDILAFLNSTNPAAAQCARDYKAADAGLIVVLRKAYDIEFVAPIDVNTGTRTQIGFLKKRYWTVFEPNAFARAPAAGRVSRTARPRRAGADSPPSAVTPMSIVGPARRWLRRLRTGASAATATGIESASKPTSLGDARADRSEKGDNEGRGGSIGPTPATVPRPDNQLEHRGFIEHPGDAAPGSGGSVRASVRGRATNDLAAYAGVFAGIKPFKGNIPQGFTVDFLGTLINTEFSSVSRPDRSCPSNRFGPHFAPSSSGCSYFETATPRFADDIRQAVDGEGWFEAVDWLESARDARGSYVMMTLGACYGFQAVGAYRALQAVNPLPCKLVAVEPVPKHIEWMRRHMRDNGIDPDEQWIVPAAVSDKTEPLFFPVGGPGVGSNNCYSTNEPAARRQYADRFIADGAANEALRNLLVNNSTGLFEDLVPGEDFKAEIKLISAITLDELLGPFSVVDLLEADIQQSEILVFPPFIDLLRHKVRRLHIGTHGEDVHAALHQLFAENGWDIVFSFKPNTTHATALGCFSTNDGLLTVRNPDL